MKKNTLIGALPVIAQALGRQLGVQVVIGHTDQADTDGKTISLPALPVDGDPRLAVLANGFIDHEAGHIRFTDFAVEKPDDLTGLLLSILEDIRIEQALIAVYPGCRRHLAALMALFAAENPLPASLADVPLPDLAAQALLAILRSRVLAQEAQTPAAHALEAELDRRLPTGVTATLVAMALEVRQADSTREVLHLAQRIVTWLAQQVPSPSSVSEGTGAGTTSVSGTNAPDQVTPASGAGGSVQKDPRSAALTALLAARAADADADLGHWAATQIKAAPGALARCVLMAEYAPPPPNRHAARRLAEARAATAALRRRLAVLVQARDATATWSTRQGRRLEPRALYRLATHDARLFRQTVEEDRPATAVGLLLDRSGSMGAHIAIAAQAVLAVALALETIPGVVCQVTAFSSPVGRVHLLPLKGFTENARCQAGRFTLTADGGTPLAEALWRTGADLCHRREPRRLMIVATDGLPKAILAAQDVLGRCRASGIEVLGLGIGQSLTAVQGVFGVAHATAITAITELAPSLFALLERHLVAPR